VYRKKRKMKIKERERERERKYLWEKDMSKKIRWTSRFSNCIRNLKSFKIKIQIHLPDHVQYDNEDFLCASGSLFVTCTCQPISKCVCIFLPPPWYNIIFQWHFWRDSVRQWEACLVLNISQL
jgi:hypothetical protein